MEFLDRILKCSDCGTDFVFTAGEQLFFFDKQFKNDPKRCKLCKAKRAGLGRSTDVNGAAVALPLSRTETRTQCSACGVETTVPFKPTQGRPVLCRSCFQLKRVPAALSVAALGSPAEQIAQQSAALQHALDQAQQALDRPNGMQAEAISPVMQAVTESPLASMSVEMPQRTQECFRSAAEASRA